MKRIIAAVTLASLLSSAAISLAGDWTSFRGNQGLGTSSESGLPTTWNASDNVVWRTELPGLGSSSPVVVGDRIYVTCYSGYGLDVEKPGDMNKLMRQVVALDRKTGTKIWQKDFAPALPESEYSGGNNTWHGYATSTPATDGTRLYVFFGRSGVYCLDLKDGAEVWHADVGSKTAGWGSGNSVVLFENLVIINASIESGAMYALDKETGKEVWKASDLKGARNTPLLVPVEGAPTELVLSLPGNPEGAIVAFDPKTGKELWRCKGIPDGGYVCPSLVADSGIVYSIGGRKNTAIAVRAGGRGDVTDSHVLWKTGKGSNVSSPVFYGGHLFWIHERQGIAFCLNAKTGEVAYEKRLEPRPGIVYSSVTAADGKIYALSQHDGAFVWAAKPEFEFLAHNKFEGDDARTNACLAITDGQLLLRNDRYLYCISK